jgi:hypothetical protein
MNWEADLKTTNARYIVDREGKKTGAILAVAQYEKLLQDLHDLAVVAERRREEPISFEKTRRRLKTKAHRGRE